MSIYVYDYTGIIYPVSYIIICNYMSIYSYNYISCIIYIYSYRVYIYIWLVYIYDTGYIIPVPYMIPDMCIIYDKDI